MSEFFNRLHGVELFFLVCAVVGGVFVLIRLVVMMIGLDHGVHEKESCQSRGKNG